MMSYQGGHGAWGRGGSAFRGGRQYGNQGRGGRQYNQGCGYSANSNWWRNRHQNYEAAGPSFVPTGYASQHSRQPYIEPREAEGSHVMGPASRGAGRQETFASQTVLAPPAAYCAPTRQKQAHWPSTGTNLDLQEGNQPRQPAAMPQATLQEAGDASELEEQMSALAIRQAMPSPSGSSIVITFLNRPGRGTRGERVLVRANHFLVDLPEKEMQLHHYDIRMTPSVTSLRTIRKVMRSLVRAYRHSHLNGRLPVYDGRLISTLEGRDFRVEITLVGYCNMRHLEMFLAGRQPNSPQDTIQALDIVLHESISSRDAIVQVRSSFFSGQAAASESVLEEQLQEIKGTTDKQTDVFTNATIRDSRYGEDVFALEYGLNVSEQTTTVEARVLPPPLLKYHDSGAEKECIPASGAWNMRNKILVNGGRVSFWYCISFSPTVGANNAEWFCKQLGDMCRTSGMEFARNPILPPVQAHGNRLEEILKSRYKEAVNALSRQDKLPELLIIILPNNSGNLYSDLKRICETDIGLITQCCLTKNVTRALPQFLANLSLKINVKVGGRNTVLADAINREVPVVSRVPTIIFGADVSHPSPGEDTKPSIASVVASQDWPEICTYTRNVKAQNHPQEFVTLLGGMVKEFLISFRRKTGLEPRQIIFYRDGVSEGQFERVLEFEMNAIRTACKQLHPDYMPGITFIVVQKRYHTRLFPMDRRNMDHRSGNILPGTVVDTQICHPSEFDFYLCSHAGTKGTSRPTHYHVLWDDNRFSVDELQTFTYNLCYTYARCTCSVSIVPPVYYAHHMAFRARSYLESGTSDTASSVAGPSMSRDEASSSALKQLP